MGTYIIKRVLLMIPTFAAISLLIFVLLNFAPGNPGAQQIGSEGGQQANTGEQRESYRLFKEQFNLDKPILVNTRYNLSRDDVEQTLAAILNLAGDVSPGDRIQAQEDMENWGNYAVPALVEIMKSADHEKVRALASQRLRVNAKKRLIGEFKGNLSPEDKAQNRIIAGANTSMREMYFVVGEDSRETPTTTEEAGAFWTTWVEQYAEDWNYTTSKKVSIFFLDTRFAKYWDNLIHLDFGVSHVDKRPVLGKVFSKLKYSITLAVTSVFLVYLISLPLGIWSAVNQNSNPDRVLTVFLLMLYSLPSFFVGVIVLNFFTMGTPLQVFPTSGFESLDTSQMTTLQYMKDVAWHVCLPILCMTYGSLAALSRYARTGLLDIIRADFIRTARAKGLPESIVIIKHAARNGMIPILTLLATMLPVLIGGSVVIEVIFGIPGMGRYMFESITTRDYNAVMAVMLISSGLTLIGMLISDLSYALVDPRITFD